MTSAFLTGIRNLRSSFLTGALLLASFFILFFDDYSSSVVLRPTATQLVELHSSMPMLIAAVAAYIVGSLFVTALEGIVDRIHRNLLFVSASESASTMRARLMSVFAPLSDSSRVRLHQEAQRFFLEKEASEDSEKEDDLEQFTRKVFADILWMEGKLTGTKLRDTYSECRAEGEFRLGVGLLLPLVAVTIGYATKMSGLWYLVLLLASVLAAIQTCNYGLYYFRCAHSFLAHHVADGSLLTPSMETRQRMTAAQSSE